MNLDNTDMRYWARLFREDGYMYKPGFFPFHGLRGSRDSVIFGERA